MIDKHIDFGSSEIMRSLERVAQEKGLIKPEPINKSAAATIDLKPSTNLMDNILKLCAGLRIKGFTKQANELEINFINYKRAQTLYETSPEKGEDIIEFAHPKGSHKLENVDGDEAVFEDILDRHLKMVQVVEKKPTGKLSNASAIKAVKLVLGQDNKDVKAQLLTDIREKINIVKNILTQIFEIANPQLSGNLSNWFDVHVNTELTKDNLDDLKDFIPKFKQRLSPGGANTGAFHTGVTNDTWDQINKWFDECDPILNEALELRHQYNEIISQEGIEKFHKNPHTMTNTSTGPLTSQYNNLWQEVLNAKNKLAQNNIIPNDIKVRLNSYLDKAASFVAKYINEYFSKNKSDPTVVQDYTNKYNTTKSSIDNVINKYNLK